MKGARDFGGKKNIWKMCVEWKRFWKLAKVTVVGRYDQNLLMRNNR